MRKHLLLAFAFLALASPAVADWTGKDASGTTITFKNPAVCSSVVCIPINSITDPTGVNGAAVPTAGADAQSNTANGLLTYTRNLFYNGTTWDRWQGVVSATQSGTWNITNIAGTISLPTGAATAAKQPALGTAGTPSTDVLSVQGEASMIPFLTNPGTATLWGLVGQASTTSGQLGHLVQCAVTTAAPTYTTAQTDPFSCDTAGNVRVLVSNTNANGQATAANSSPVVLPAAQITVDPCSLGNKTNLPIAQNGTASVQLIALSGATVVYVCSLSLIAAGATTVSITTGTGSACVTGNAAVIGSTTANIATQGMSLAANGGLTLGNGAGTIAKGAASSELCMILGTSVFVSGNLTYVQL